MKISRITVYRTPIDYINAVGVKLKFPFIICLSPMHPLNGNSFSSVFSIHTSNSTCVAYIHSLEFKQHSTPFVLTDGCLFCSCFLLVECTF